MSNKEQVELIKYLAQAIPAARIECAGCSAKREAAKAVIRSDQFFCSEACADRTLAPLVKPQPKAVRVDGWAV